MALGSNTSGHLFDTTFTADGVLYADASGVVTSTGAGSTGQVITSNGAGVAPTYQNAGGGGITEYFSTYLSGTTGNVTGDGTIYGPIIFDGILANTGNYNAATGIYTCPSTGIYSFNQTIFFTTTDVAVTQFIPFFNGSAFSIRAFQLELPAGSGNVATSSSIMIPMTIGDTMSCYALASGGIKDCAIFGSVPTGYATTSLFSGFKVA